MAKKEAKEFLVHLSGIAYPEAKCIVKAWGRKQIRDRGITRHIGDILVEEHRFVDDENCQVEFEFYEKFSITRIEDLSQAEHGDYERLCPHCQQKISDKLIYVDLTDGED